MIGHVLIATFGVVLMLVGAFGYPYLLIYEIFESKGIDLYKTRDRYKTPVLFIGVFLSVLLLLIGAILIAENLSTFFHCDCGCLS